MAYYTQDLIKGYAEGIGWSNVSVNYHLASQYDEKYVEEKQSGLIIFGGLLAVALGLVAVGTLVEISTIGDRPEYKTEDMIQPMYEASKFRRLT